MVKRTGKMPKGYKYTGLYSWTKKKAEERAKIGNKQFFVKVLPAKTVNSKRQAYALLAKLTKSKKGWAKRK